MTRTCHAPHTRTRISDKMECAKCDAACATCHAPTDDGCDTCASGYVVEETENGDSNAKRCVDVDECAASSNDKEHNTLPCADNTRTYCDNTLGSFQCTACHLACAAPAESDDLGKWCSGPGPENCTACADGYKPRSEAGCVDVDECAEEGAGKCEVDQYVTLPPSLHNNVGYSTCIKHVSVEESIRFFCMNTYRSQHF